MSSVVFHGKSDIPEVVALRQSETVLEFVRRAHGTADVEIACIGVRDADEDLELEAVLIDVAADGEHIHHSRKCRHIAVSVRYGGHPSRSREFKPHTTVGKVLQWAEKEYGIPPDQRGQFRLKLPNVQEYLENDELLGELVTGAPCELKLDLVRTEQNAGARREPRSAATPR
jgi:hypothetical protein